MEKDKLKLQGYLAILIAIILIIVGLVFIFTPPNDSKTSTPQAQETQTSERLKLTYTQKIGQWHTINIYHDEQTGYNCYESVYEEDAGSTGVGFSCV